MNGAEGGGPPPDRTSPHADFDRKRLKLGWENRRGTPEGGPLLSKNDFHEFP